MNNKFTDNEKMILDLSEFGVTREEELLLYNQYLLPEVLKRSKKWNTLKRYLKRDILEIPTETLIACLTMPTAFVQKHISLYKGNIEHEKLILLEEAEKIDPTLNVSLFLSMRLYVLDVLMTYMRNDGISFKKALEKESKFFEHDGTLKSYTEMLESVVIVTRKMSSREREGRMRVIRTAIKAGVPIIDIDRLEPLNTNLARFIYALNGLQLGLSVEQIMPILQYAGDSSEEIFNKMLDDLKVLPPITVLKKYELGEEELTF